MATSADTSNGFDWGSLLGGAIQGAGAYFGGRNATDALTGAEGQAINQQQQTQAQLGGIYGNQRALGNGADASLSAQLGLGGTPDYTPFYNSPGFQFSQQMGNQAIQRSAAANGSLYTPNTLASLSQFNTGLASQNYNTYIGQLMQAAGLGAQGNQGLASGTVQTGNNIGQLLQNQGNARAAGAANTSGVASSLLSKVPWNNVANGVGNELGGLNYNGTYSPGDLSGYNVDFGGSDVTNTDYSNLFGDGFSGAGGQAAGLADASGATNAALSNQGDVLSSDLNSELGTTGGGAGSASSALGALGGAADIYGVYSGIQKGGVGGYGQAAIDAYKGYNTISPLLGGGAAAGIGGIAAANAAGSGILAGAGSGIGAAAGSAIGDAAGAAIGSAAGGTAAGAGAAASTGAGAGAGAGLGVVGGAAAAVALPLAMVPFMLANSGSFTAGGFVNSVPGSGIFTPQQTQQLQQKYQELGEDGFWDWFKNDPTFKVFSQTQLNTGNKKPTYNQT